MVPPCQVERYRLGVRSFQLDQHLAPYDLNSWNGWRQLSGHISADVVQAVQPLGGNMSILAEADPSLLRPATAAEAALYEQLQKGREAKAAAAAAAAEAAAAGGQAPAGAATGMQVDQQPTTGAAPVAAAEQQQQQQQQQQQEGEASRVSAAPHAGRCYYTPLPRLVKRGGLTPQELTGGVPALSAAAWSCGAICCYGAVLITPPLNCLPFVCLLRLGL
jgi:A1 cistron-splicing factor AAR2